MSAQGLEVIDHTVQQAHEWINELTERLNWPDRKQALLLLRATLTEIRDMLSHDEAAHLAAQLPAILRGFYYEGWRPTKTPVKARHRADFVERVSSRLKGSTSFNGEADIEEVFRLLNHRVSEGEIADVRQSLPADLRALWPE